jgi:PKD repeat protein
MMKLNWRGASMRLMVWVLCLIALWTPITELPEEIRSLRISHRKALSIKFALEDNFERTKDPALGYPPTERLAAAIDYAQRLQQEMARGEKFFNDLPDAFWRERGPDNYAGRTRAILIDLNDPTRRTIWAGSVSGGLWKCSNITADPPVWEIASDYLENMAVGALAQDPRNPQIIYMGTGEGFNNLDAVRGRGIYRSSNGGETWEVLASTLISNFRYTRDLLVHPQTGDVYAATNQGLMRSSNGGESWTRVLGISAGLANNEMYDIQYVASADRLFASNANAVWRSTSGDPGSWQNIATAATGFPQGLARVEMTVSPTNANIIYIIGNVDGGASNVFSTNNGGTTWTQRARPNNNNGNEFTNGQAWYDLEIAVDPFNPNHVIAGGVGIMRSLNGGASWSFFANNMHVDQHKVLFDPAQEGVIYFGNDGGIYRSVNGSASNVPSRKRNFNVTQFYACAFHPAAGSNYMLGGTQDNNSIQMNASGISSGRTVRGGDGMFCHIDQENPNIQMVSSQFGNYSLSTDGGQTFSGAANLDGRFIAVSDYDNVSKILYSQTNAAGGDYYRWNVLSGSTELVDIQSFAVNISSITVDPNTPNRVYFGSFSNGRIFRVDNAHEGAVVTGVALSPLPGTVASLDIEVGNPEHMLATVSNYGVPSVFESFNGGQNWVNIEGNLPDMPVRWGVFNPSDSRQAMIATEAGVWISEALDGANTLWLPPLPGIGIPLVRTDMIKVRRADRVVLAATHGRGLYTSEVFAEPAVRAIYEPISYQGVPVRFTGDLSANASSYFWEFGDGATSASANPTHTYSAVGTYSVRLTINGTLSTQSSHTVLPNRPLPYIDGRPSYGGDFEGFTEQYAVHTLSGSAFERGKSTISKKDGVRSGQNAFVLGLEEASYQPNTRSILYLPNFDMSEVTFYDFSFWGKWEIQNGLDGFRVEYSVDKGRNWTPLVNQNIPGWYNFRNSNVPGAAFPIGDAYFTSNRSNWEQFKVNISHLGGNPDVAFRFVFQSDGSGVHAGLALDDVQINKYEGELATQLVNFRGSFPNTTQIQLDWDTELEYYCRQFEVERSINGRDFEKIATLNATGVLTAFQQSYSNTSLGLRNLYFFRIKVINENTPTGYNYVFYSPVIAMQRTQAAGRVNRVFPIPFGQKIGITFNGLLERPIRYELFDIAGRMVLKGQSANPGAYLEIDTGNRLAQGAYLLRLQFEDGTTETFKIAGGW